MALRGPINVDQSPAIEFRASWRRRPAQPHIDTSFLRPRMSGRQRSASQEAADLLRRGEPCGQLRAPRDDRDDGVSTLTCTFLTFLLPTLSSTPLLSHS